MEIMSDGAQVWYVFSFFKDRNSTGILLGIIKINTNHNHSKKLVLRKSAVIFASLPHTMKKVFQVTSKIKFLLINATF